MASVFSYLISMFGVLFWVFRIIVVLCTTTDTEFIVQSLNPTVEIVLSFTTLFCFLLIFKRKLSGALIYLLTYLGYFGADIYKTITELQTTGIVASDYLQIAFSVLGVLIAFLTFIDIGINNGRKSNGTHKGTDWFYKNEDYDRKFDERADRNQYKF